ncbi:MAG TPA: radical SAM protein [Terriglobales bacterium]|nr:radical SAM protein [Terriglobales bacterium]
MGALLQEVCTRAEALHIPLSIHLDLTYRCNERCVHCYLDHDDHGELSREEVFQLLDDLAEAGTLILTLSGGEPLLRPDFFAIAKRARSLRFSLKVKTNGILIGPSQAALLRDYGVHQVQMSIYSHRAEVHDGITKIRGSLARSVAAIRLLRAYGVNVAIATPLMAQNFADYPGVRALAAEMGVAVTIDPTITPKIDGDTSILRHRISTQDLQSVFRDSSLVGDVQNFSACTPVDDDVLASYPCSAGHTFCYISPYGDVFPCVQFPLPCGNIRRQSWRSIWVDSPELQRVRSIQLGDLPTCSSCVHASGCSRCPGLAYMEGNMYGPSSADCEKSLARTGVVPKAWQPNRSADLIQISLENCGR